jgi:hypothetical protein
METRKRYEKIPFIRFPADWDIKIVPPFSWATIRFAVRKWDKIRSVYLDCYGKLWARYEPYWELYPYLWDCFRCDMNDVDVLLKAIEDSFNENILDD